MPPHKSPTEWLGHQVAFLSGWGDQVGAESPLVFHDYGPHTVLKLAALNYLIGIFSPIARAAVDKGRYGSSVYLDLFAGCGMTKVRGSGDFVAGSPILAAHAKKPFDQIICVEKHALFRGVLERRLALAGAPNASVLPGDCNEAVEQIIAKLEGARPIIFATVDPEGMEILWETMVRLSESWNAIDFFINLTAGAERAFQEAKVRGGSTHAVEGLMGKTLPEILLDEHDELSDQYQARVRNVLGKPLGKGSLIRDEGNMPKYRVLVFARQTRGGSPWYSAYEAVHEKLDALTAANAVGALNTLKGRGLAGEW